VKPKIKYDLVDMLKYRRKHGTESIKDFCEKYLHPVFGYPDVDDNYELIIGKDPKICFAAHYDSVHNSDGMQELEVSNNIVSLAKGSTSNCLGADCATGVWLILEMIRSGIEGVYVVHAYEESGCKGSKALVKHNPRWLDHCEAVISFDRLGLDSIITHQSGVRTCSDTFADSLSSILGMGHYADRNGSYTDSNEYRYLVPECTNLSVGYYAQHTKNESQDLTYAVKLLDALRKADWSKLVIERDPSVIEYDQETNWRNWGLSYYGNYDRGTSYGKGQVSSLSASKEERDSLSAIEEIIDVFPEAVAMLLQDCWGSPEALLDVLADYGAQTEEAVRYVDLW